MVLYFFKYYSFSVFAEKKMEQQILNRIHLNLHLLECNRSWAHHLPVANPLGEQAPHSFVQDDVQGRIVGLLDGVIIQEEREGKKVLNMNNVYLEFEMVHYGWDIWRTLLLH